MTQTLVETETTNGDNGEDEVCHYFCRECGEDLSLCGEDISEDEVVPVDVETNDVWCIVCATYTHCPRCGVRLVEVL